jgi:hypothetical protein
MSTFSPMDVEKPEVSTSPEGSSSVITLSALVSPIVLEENDAIVINTANKLKQKILPFIPNPHYGPEMKLGFIY